MDDRRVLNLEAMDEEEATRLLTQLASALSPEGEYQIRHPEDYVMEMLNWESASGGGRT